MGKKRRLSEITGLPLTDAEQWELEKARVREWKRKDRRRRGVALKGQHIKIPRTPEQIEQSKINRRAYDRKYTMEYKKEKPEKRLFWAATRRAKQRGLEFNIELSDIVIPTHCPILGMKLSLHAPRGTCRDTVMSLDRIECSKGYVKGNIQVISHLANTLKSKATIAQMQMFSDYVIRTFPR